MGKERGGGLGTKQKKRGLLGLHKERQATGGLDEGRASDCLAAEKTQQDGGGGGGETASEEAHGRDTVD